MTQAPLHWMTQSPLGQKMIERLRLASTTPLALYLHGETGVGKELLARQAHDWSPQMQGPFIALHCASLSLQLAESELFGHRKGAFTGAIQSRQGALASAHGGTLFLDEIGELTAELQIKLLRFLENGEYRAVGSDQTLYSSARIICATHRDLAEAVREGRFREDLYFRLTGITIAVPPLRARPGDAWAQAQAFAHVHGFVLSTDCAEPLARHMWPGNSRELKRCIERAVFLRGKPRLNAGQGAHLFAEDLEFHSPRQPHNSPDGEWHLPSAERVLILRALRAHGGNRASTAEALGIARSTLFEKLRRYRLELVDHQA